MSWTSYPDYEDSHVDWAGPTPADWKTAAIKYFGEVTLGKMLQSESRSEHDSFRPYLRAAHIQPTGLSFEVAEQSMWFSPAESRDLDLLAGDVVVVEGGAGYGRSTTIESNMEGWGFQNSINRIRPNTDNEGRFIDYCLKAALASGYLEVVCGVATIPHLTAEKLSAERIPLPPPATQRAVCQFLDRETAKIDALIDKQEQLIAALREDRAATITHAVTKGLNTDIAIDDSTVEWIGNYPRHWDIVPVRAALDESDIRNVGATDQRYLSLMANVGVIPYEEKGDVGNKKPEDLSKCKKVSRNDLVINSMNYQIGSYGLSAYDGVCSPVYIVLRHKPEVVSLSGLHSAYSKRVSSRSMPSLSVTEFSSIDARLVGTP